MAGASPTSGAGGAAHLKAKFQIGSKRGMSARSERRAGGGARYDSILLIGLARGNR